MHLVTTLLVLAGLSWTDSAYAEPIGINLLNAVFTTSVSAVVQQWDPDTNSFLDPLNVVQTQSTPNPHTNELTLFNDLNLARADTFAVDVYTSSSAFFRTTDVLQSRASATTVLDFSVGFDLLAPITVGASAADGPFSSGSVILKNLTTDLVLWDVGWDRFGGNGPYGFEWLDGPLREGPIAFNTLFNSTDVYRLTMTTESSSRGDAQGSAMSVSGLYVAPEPSLIMLLGLGLGACVSGRRFSTTRH